MIFWLFTATKAKGQGKDECFDEWTNYEKKCKLHAYCWLPIKKGRSPNEYNLSWVDSAQHVS